MAKLTPTPEPFKSIDKPEYDVVRALLRAFRKGAGLSQGALGEALGRGQSFASDCELGIRRLDVLQVHEWCRVCGKTFTDFARRLDETLELLPSTRAPQKDKRRKPSQAPK